jgi:hypothetical protein
MAAKNKTAFFLGTAPHGFVVGQSSLVEQSDQTVEDQRHVRFFGRKLTSTKSVPTQSGH